MNMNKPNVLIIDDEIGMCETLEDILEEHNFAAESAYDGKTGLKKIKKKKFNAVILDLKLPDLNGIKVLEKIKKYSPETEVVIITAYATLENAVEAINKGAYSYITKPIDVNELINFLKKAIEKQKLIEENKRLRELNENIVKSMDEGIIIVDLEGRIMFVNPAVEKHLGYSEEELIGKSWKGLIPKNIIMEIEEKMLKAERGDVSKHSGVLFKKGGGFISVIFSIVPFFEKKEHKGMLITFTDISERERMEAELKKKVEELQKINKFLVGRELRMVELKERIRELEEELKTLRSVLTKKE